MLRVVQPCRACFCVYKMATEACENSGDNGYESILQWKNCDTDGGSGDDWVLHPHHHLSCLTDCPIV